jgi:hypothetical protein
LNSLSREFCIPSAGDLTIEPETPPSRLRPIKSGQAFSGKWSRTPLAASREVETTLARQRDRRVTTANFIELIGGSLVRPCDLVHKGPSPHKLLFIWQGMLRADPPFEWFSNYDGIHDEG